MLYCYRTYIPSARQYIVCHCCYLRRATLPKKPFCNMRGNMLPDRSGEIADEKSSFVARGDCFGSIRLSGAMCEHRWTCVFYAYVSKWKNIPNILIVGDVMSCACDWCFIVSFRLSIRLSVVHGFCSMLHFQGIGRTLQNPYSQIEDCYPSVDDWSYIPYGTIQWSKNTSATCITVFFALDISLFIFEYWSVINMMNTFSFFVRSSGPRSCIAINTGVPMRRPYVSFVCQRAAIMRAWYTVAYLLIDACAMCSE